MVNRLPAICKTLGTAFGLLLIAALPAQANTKRPETITGVVTAVDDGDTLTLQADDGRCIEVRMSDYDSPEIAHRPGQTPACGGSPGNWPPAPYPGQPGGEDAGKVLRDLALGHRATALCYGSGGYGRLACHVTVDGQVESLNRQVIRAGWGLIFTRSNWVHDPQSRAIEAEAIAAHRGRWGLPAWQALDPYWWRTNCWKKGGGQPDNCPGASAK
ncbi:thermonuclease family protein [Ferrovibrio xuzhouensis]|uniref:Thermonuclease family protein n=1 Tax=Ferrovibrio xuzhouensis TaxID=1576914 RepID=A0ABV7VB62_9PROT